VYRQTSRARLPSGPAGGLRTRAPPRSVAIARQPHSGRRHGIFCWASASAHSHRRDGTASAPPSGRLSRALGANARALRIGTSTKATQRVVADRKRRTLIVVQRRGIPYRLNGVHKSPFRREEFYVLWSLTKWASGPSRMMPTGRAGRRVRGNRPWVIAQPMHSGVRAQGVRIDLLARRARGLMPPDTSLRSPTPCHERKAGPRTVTRSVPDGFKTQGPRFARP